MAVIVFDNAVMMENFSSQVDYNTQVDNIKKQINLYQSDPENPKSSSLFFEKMGNWYLTCHQDCPWIPVGTIVPEIAIDILNYYSINDTMTIYRFVEIARQYY